MGKRSIKTLAAISLAAMLMMFLAGCGTKKTIEAGSTWEVAETTKLNELTIAEGAGITDPEGYSVTMTVDGVERGIVPGTYKGDVVLTVSEANVVKYFELVHNFRQALYVDETGVVAEKSVLPAAGNYSISNDGILAGADITSVGENFNGIYVCGGTHTVKDAVIDFTGNGGNDFAGYGAAVMATGRDTTLILDGAKIWTKGVVRTAVVASGGSNVIVKNSDIKTLDGVLPADYVPNVTLGEMLAAPWMLGISGNCRATNLLGMNTCAAYINSSISSEYWGVLSVDVGDDGDVDMSAITQRREENLIAINSKIVNTGKMGYGAYSNVSYYGCEIDVGDYAVIGGGIFAASNPETVTRLNNNYDLELTPEEIKALPATGTTVKSGRFGMMLRGTAKIMDDTVFNTEKAIFLIKGNSADISVDGSKGAQLNPRNGIIIQVMDNDDPGAFTADGKPPTEMGAKMYNTGVYQEPSDPVKAKDFDVASIHDSDVIAAFSDITLEGDFYNGFPGGDTGVVKGAGAPSGGSASGINMVLNLSNAGITGIITSSRSRHAKDAINGDDYRLLGEVTNTPCPAVNNGVIVSMTGSTWTVTGTSYLTGLTIGEGSSVTAPEGYRATMTVDGASKEIKAGTYRGDIIITVTKS